MKLIINADDFGYSQSVNNAIIKLVEKKVLFSTSVMVNMPFFKETSALKNIPNISIGLHFNLTEGYPVSNLNRIPSLVDKYGLFFSHNVFKKKLLLKKINIDDIYRELKVQFQLLESVIGQTPDHIDSHQNIHKQYFVAKTLLDFAKEKKELSIRNPKRFFLIENKSSFYIRNQLPSSFGYKKIRSIITNKYIDWLANKYRLAFNTPAGELHHSSHKKIDFFKWMIKCKNPAETNLVYEIPCHPADSNLGLKCSKLKEKRVKEFEIMNSDPFQNALSKFSLLTFKDLKKE